MLADVELCMMSATASAHTCRVMHSAVRHVRFSNDLQAFKSIRIILNFWRVDVAKVVTTPERPCKMKVEVKFNDKGPDIF